MKTTCMEKMFSVLFIALMVGTSIVPVSLLMNENATAFEPPESGDSDGDGMTDSWEMEIVKDDPSDGIYDENPDDETYEVEDVKYWHDYDNDGYRNLAEFVHGTDPTNDDSNNDDSSHLYYQLSDTPDHYDEDDYDEDGVCNFGEYVIEYVDGGSEKWDVAESSHSEKDTDGDELPDWWEMKYQSNPIVPNTYEDISTPGGDSYQQIGRITGFSIDSEGELISIEEGVNDPSLTNSQKISWESTETENIMPASIASTINEEKPEEFTGWILVKTNWHLRPCDYPAKYYKQEGITDQSTEEKTFFEAYYNVYSGYVRVLYFFAEGSDYYGEKIYLEVIAKNSNTGLRSETPILANSIDAQELNVVLHEDYESKTYSSDPEYFPLSQEYPNTNFYEGTGSNQYMLPAHKMTPTTGIANDKWYVFDFPVNYMQDELDELRFTLQSFDVQNMDGEFFGKGYVHGSSYLSGSSESTTVSVSTGTSFGYPQLASYNLFTLGYSHTSSDIDLSGGFSGTTHFLGYIAATIENKLLSDDFILEYNPILFVGYYGQNHLTAFGPHFTGMGLFNVRPAEHYPGKDNFYPSESEKDWLHGVHVTAPDLDLNQRLLRFVDDDTGDENDDITYHLKDDYDVEPNNPANQQDWFFYPDADSGKGKWRTSADGNGEITLEWKKYDHVWRWEERNDDDEIVRFYEMSKIGDPSHSENQIIGSPAIERGHLGYALRSHQYLKEIDPIDEVESSKHGLYLDTIQNVLWEFKDNWNDYEDTNDESWRRCGDYNHYLVEENEYQLSLVEEDKTYFDIDGNEHKIYENYANLQDNDDYKKVYDDYAYHTVEEGNSYTTKRIMAISDNNDDGDDEYMIESLMDYGEFYYPAYPHTDIKNLEDNCGYLGEMKKDENGEYETDDNGNLIPKVEDKEIVKEEEIAIELHLNDAYLSDLTSSDLEIRGHFLTAMKTSPFGAEEGLLKDSDLQNAMDGAEREKDDWEDEDFAFAFEHEDEDDGALFFKAEPGSDYDDYLQKIPLSMDRIMAMLQLTIDFEYDVSKDVTSEEADSVTSPLKIHSSQVFVQDFVLSRFDPTNTKLITDQYAYTISLRQFMNRRGAGDQDIFSNNEEDYYLNSVITQGTSVYVNSDPDSTWGCDEGDTPQPRAILCRTLFSKSDDIHFDMDFRDKDGLKKNSDDTRMGKLDEHMSSDDIFENYEDAKYRGFMAENVWNCDDTRFGDKRYNAWYLWTVGMSSSNYEPKIGTEFKMDVEVHHKTFIDKPRVSSLSGVRLVKDEPSEGDTQKTSANYNAYQSFFVTNYDSSSEGATAFRLQHSFSDTSRSALEGCEKPFPDLYTADTPGGPAVAPITVEKNHYEKHRSMIDQKIGADDLGELSEITSSPDTLSCAFPGDWYKHDVNLYNIDVNPSLSISTLSYRTEVTGEYDFKFKPEGATSKNIDPSSPDARYTTAEYKFILSNTGKAPDYYLLSMENEDGYPIVLPDGWTAAFVQKKDTEGEEKDTGLLHYDTLDQPWIYLPAGQSTTIYLEVTGVGSLYDVDQGRDSTYSDKIIYAKAESLGPVVNENGVLEDNGLSPQKTKTLTRIEDFVFKINPDDVITYAKELGGSVIERELEWDGEDPYDLTL